MRRALLAATSVALLAASARETRAQSCLGLPAQPHVTLALGFEGTDGLSGNSAAVMSGRRVWGVQVRAERYDDQPTWRGPWYGGEVQVSRAWRSGGEPAGAPERARPVCSTAGMRYQHDVDGDARYQRLRVPLGLAWGPGVALARDAHGTPAAVLTPFVQTQLLLQHERWQRDAAVPAVTRRRATAAGVAGFGLSGGPLLVRTAVQYAALPEFTLNGRPNWFELTLQLGVSF